MGTQRFARREALPVIPDGNFVYRFLPLQNMEHIAVTYQTQLHDPNIAADYIVHVFPFATMPTTSSHIHPKFAIVELGRKLSVLAAGLPQDVRLNLFAATPILANIFDIFQAWTTPIPTTAKSDAAFNSSPNDGDDDDDVDDADESNDPDYDERQSDRTALYRLSTMPKGCAERLESRAGPQSRSSEDGESPPDYIDNIYDSLEPPASSAQVLAGLSPRGAGRLARPIRKNVTK